MSEAPLGVLERGAPGKYATMENPVQSDMPMDLAEAFYADKCVLESGRPGLRFWMGAFWAYEGTRWTRQETRWVEDRVLLWLGRAYKAVFKKVKGETECVGAERVMANVRLMHDVVRCLEGLTLLREARMPSWLGAQVCDPMFAVAFEDVVVDVKKWAETGECVTYERDDRYFEQQVVPCKWDRDAESPLLERCLGEWGGGDPVWREVWLREAGYRLIGFRGYRTWFMHYGPTQGGKTTMEAVVRLVTGGHGYMGKQMASLGRQFGMEKLATARQFVVNEVTDLEKTSRGAAGALLKNIIGQDAIDLDRKYKEQLENIVSNTVVVLLGNEMPKLPNKGRGLSSKMVPLNFDVSFERTKDELLVEKLGRELPGMSRMMVEAVVRVVAAKTHEERWPLTESARFSLARFEAMNNPADEFLAWAFNRNEGGFVETEMAWGFYTQWCNEYKLKPEGRNQFNEWLEENNSWGVRATRRNGRSREFSGVSLKKFGVGNHTDDEKLAEQARMAHVDRWDREIVRGHE